MSLAASALLLALFYGRPRGHCSGKAGLMEPRDHRQASGPVEEQGRGRGSSTHPDQTTEKPPIPLPAPAPDFENSQAAENDSVAEERVTTTQRT